MRLVKRKDGKILNLSAVLIFTPHNGNMHVEFPGNKLYVIENFEFFDLNTSTNIFEKEFIECPWMGVTE